jgi:dihydrodipicolinate synthase/N-acetylneuraminate lyase
VFRFTTAIGTPLTEDERLHEKGLQAHLADQWGAGISGILVAGSMGAMQLLSDDTYVYLVERSVQLSKGRGEVFVGAGDAGFARTRDRIRFLNEQKIDGVVVLPPFLFSFGQEELIDYYRGLADVSRAPLYLYDLPALTRTKLRLETVLELARHPNIRGIKCSDEPGYTRQLIDLATNSFRVIIAQLDLIDVFLRHGVRDHLDGMFAIAPGWVVALGRCAERGDWDAAARYQRNISALRRVLMKHGVFPTFTVLMNARGIQGRFAPRPFRSLSDREREVVLADPVVRELLSGRSAAVGSG